MPKENETPQWRDIGRKTLTSGFVNLIAWRGQFQRFSGDWSAVIERELVLRGHAVAVLPIDTATDSVLLINQFRIGSASEPGGPWQTEIIAGLVEPGESFEDVARREAFEEAGLILDSLVPIMRYQPSPGASDETLHLFLAPTDLSKAGGLFGLESESEDIFTFVEPVSRALDRLASGDFGNSMIVIALQWLALERVQGRWIGG